MHALEASAVFEAHFAWKRSNQKKNGHFRREGCTKRKIKQKQSFPKNKGVPMRYISWFCALEIDDVQLVILWVYTSDVFVTILFVIGAVHAYATLCCFDVLSLFFTWYLCLSVQPGTGIMFSFSWAEFLSVPCTKHDDFRISSATSMVQTFLLYDLGLFDAQLIMKKKYPMAHSPQHPARSGRARPKFLSRPFLASPCAS